MSYGFKAINDSGITQIDENTEAFHVLASGVSPTGVLAYIDIPSSYPEEVMVVARPHNPDLTKAYSLKLAWSDGGSPGGVRTRKCYLNCEASTSPNLTQPAGACDYAIIEPASNVPDPTSGYGLVVYRADGTVAFSSESQTFRARASRNFEITEPPPAVASTTTWPTAGQGIWYQGTAGEIDEMYAFGTSYSSWMTEDWNEELLGGGLNFFSQRWRYALFDYPSDAFGIHVGYNNQNQSNTYFREMNVATGYKTEILGYIS